MNEKPPYCSAHQASPPLSQYTHRPPPEGAAGETAAAEGPAESNPHPSGLFAPAPEDGMGRQTLARPSITGGGDDRDGGLSGLATPCRSRKYYDCDIPLLTSTAPFTISCPFQPKDGTLNLN
jgi:hypothetical protein